MSAGLVPYRGSEGESGPGLPPGCPQMCLYLGLYGHPSHLCLLLHVAFPLCVSPFPSLIRTLSLDSRPSMTQGGLISRSLLNYNSRDPYSKKGHGHRPGCTCIWRATTQPPAAVMMPLSCQFRSFTSKLSPCILFHVLLPFSGNTQSTEFVS